MKKSKHSGIGTALSTRWDPRRKQEKKVPYKGEGRPALIAALSAPADPLQLQQAFARGGCDMALLDDAGLRADTARYTEERFFALYREVITAAHGTPLLLPLYPKEASGDSWLLQAHGTSFAQHSLYPRLCAALRASALGPLSLLLPLARTAQEILSARRMVEDAMRELLTRHISFDETVPLGISLGTPASLLLSRTLLQEVDFLLIDTDRLTSLSLSAAPGSAAFFTLLEESAPALLRLIEIGIGNAHACGRFAALCGSVATNPRLLPHFLAMGADALTVPAEQLTRTQMLIRSLL